MNNDKYRFMRWLEIHINASVIVLFLTSKSIYIPAPFFSNLVWDC
jgi:hypothetical protein